MLHRPTRAIFAGARATAFATLAPAHRDATARMGQVHGPLEVRRAWVTSDPEILAFLDPGGAWVALRALGPVEARCRVGTNREVEQRHDLPSEPLGERAAFAATRASRPPPLGPRR